MTRCKVRIAACLLLPLWLSLVSCLCNPGVSENLAVTLHPQEENQWCWAASGQMVMDFLGNNVAQCTQANDRFGRTDCPCDQCSLYAVAGPDCDSGGWPDFDHYGFTFKQTTDKALTWKQLTKELSSADDCGGTPFAFTWHWDGGGGHIMVAVGYETIGGVDYVYMLNPWGRCTGDAWILTYDEYVSGSGYTHWDDLYEIRP